MYHFTLYLCNSYMHLQVREVCQREGTFLDSPFFELFGMFAEACWSFHRLITFWFQSLPTKPEGDSCTGGPLTDATPSASSLRGHMASIWHVVDHFRWAYGVSGSRKTSIWESKIKGSLHVDELSGARWVHGDGVQCSDKAALRKAKVHTRFGPLMLRNLEVLVSIDAPAAKWRTFLLLANVGTCSSSVCAESTYVTMSWCLKLIWTW